MTQDPTTISETSDIETVPGTYFFGTPYTRVGASVGYINSLIPWAINAHTTRPRLVGSLVAGGTSYGIQRNHIVYAALKAKAEWLLLIDDDITFPHDIVQRLANTGSKVAIGAVPISTTEMNVWIGEPDGLVPKDSLMPRNGAVQETTAYGCAVALIHVDVIVAIGESFGWSSWFNCEKFERQYGNGQRLETQLEPDLSFALKVRKLGIAAKARFDLSLSHSKPIELRYSL